jgi:murein DD-endopeptidase MepM/ murein hydrolase activator NlpD
MPEEATPAFVRLLEMRLHTPALAAAAVAGLLLVPPAPAQAPAHAGAVADVAAGDLGIVGRASVRGGGRDSAQDAAARPGMEIAGGRASVSATRAGGDASARASATAEGVSLFDGLVTAERVTRSATADGAVSYGGSIRGLVVNGVDRGDLRGVHRWSAGGARVTINRGGEGLRVRLTRAVAGFAAGTTVVVAAVRAEAVDGADPAATPQPAATPEPSPAATPEPAATAEPAERAEPAKPRITPVQRLARGRFVFPVYGNARVADDFGAARQIGAHEGNDIFAPFGSPVLAVADGKLNRVGTLPISGNRLWLKTERGDSFFYAHMSAFAPEAVNGRAVKAGTLLGFVGNTGDAEPTPPHLHFEIHPGDRKAIDPHAVLAAWETRGLVPSGGWLARYGSDTEARPGALVEVRDFIAGE